MALKPRPNFQLLGLYTNVNDYSGIPDGGMSVADNVSITEQNVVRSRRGFTKFKTALNNIKQLIEYNNTLFVYHNTNTLSYSGGSPEWETYTTTLSGTDGYIYPQEAAGELYIATSTGVYVIDAVGSEPVLAGGVKATSGEVAAYNSGVFLDNDKQCAYRLLWGYKNANQRNIYGVPSDRLIYRNISGGAVGVTLTLDIPDNVDTNYFYQLYRSEQEDILGEPNDELRLVYEGNPSSNDITAGYITINDDTADSNRQADLYTNISQRGPENSYYPPPLAKDICWWSNRMFYGNTAIHHQLIINITRVGGSTGIQVGDTITIGDVVYTAGLTESVAGKTFAVPGGSPLVVPSYAIESAALSLIRVINRCTDSVVDAFYLSGFDDFPGQILLESKSPGGDAISIISTRGEAWSPNLTTASITTNEVKTNRIYYSLEGQPEAVPLLNYFDIGGENDVIKRLFAQQDFLYAFTNKGIYRISGTTKFAAVQISTAKIQAPRSIALIRNNILCYTDQGVVMVTNTGVQDNISTNIEKDLVKLTDNSYINFSTTTNACAYESERLYLVATVSDSEDTIANQVYVYNTVFGGWTKWLLNVSSMLISQTDNKLYYADDSQVYVERKDFVDSDYADESYEITISEQDGANLTVSDAANLGVDYKLIQGDVVGIITAVDYDQDIITVDNTYVWSVGSPNVATAYTPIECIIKFSKDHCGDPSVIKQYSYFVSYFTRQVITNRLVFGFGTDMYGATELVRDIDQLFGVLGQYVWGMEDLGGGLAEALPVAVLVPRNTAIGRWIDLTITHKEAHRSFGYSGYVLLYKNLSRVVK